MFQFFHGVLLLLCFCIAIASSRSRLSRLHTKYVNLEDDYAILQNEYKALMRYATNNLNYDYYDWMTDPEDIFNQAATTECKWSTKDADANTHKPASNCDFGLSDAVGFKVLKAGSILWRKQKTVTKVTTAAFFYTKPDFIKLAADEFLITYKVKTDIDVFYYQNYKTKYNLKHQAFVLKYNTELKQTKVNCKGFASCNFCELYLEVSALNEIDLDPASHKEKKDSIAKLRIFSKYLKDLSNDPLSKEIAKLLKTIFDWISFEESANEAKIAERFNPTDKYFPDTVAGKVKKDYATVKAVVDGGNVREQCTLIMATQISSCDLLWKVLFNYHLKSARWNNKYKDWFNAADIQRRIKYLQELTGFTMDQMDTKLDKQADFYSKPTFPSLCHQSRYTKMGPLFARALRYPETRDTVKKIARYPKYIEIYPTLTAREKAMIQQTTSGTQFTWGAQEKIPWSTGYYFFDMKPESIWYKMAAAYGLLSVSGPSATAGVMYDIATTFKNINLDKAFGGFVIWMGIPPDHSLHEMIQAIAVPYYGIEYNVQQDPYVWLINKLQL